MPKEYSNFDNQPWWMRVLEKQGIATVFALVMLAAFWKIGSAHIDFLQEQIVQMRMQTNILEEISESNARQEDGIQKLRSAVEKTDK
jgi:cell division protein FtsB